MTEAEFERHTGCPRTHGKAVFGTLAAQEAKGGKTRKAMITKTRGLRGRARLTVSVCKMVA